jgi:hypothetical protein
MNWLKGLVAPAAQFGGSPQGQQGQQGGPPPQQGDMPPYGGAPNQYGVQQNQMMPPQQQQMPGMQMGLPDANQWSTGTRTQGSPQGAGQGQSQGISGGGISGSSAAALGGGDRIAALEARCVELQNDCGSLALFARTLLTMLEDAKVVTREQFMETKSRLDMLDGKMDDR